MISSSNDSIFKKYHTKEIREKIGEITLVILPEMIEDRMNGFGKKWNDDREKHLQSFLDEVSAKYMYDFRDSYYNYMTLYPDEYKIDAYTLRKRKGLL